MSTSFILNEIGQSAIESVIEVNRTSFANQWTYLPTKNLSTKAQNLAYRLNALGSSFYFIKVILRKHRLSNSFHRLYCNQFECSHLQEVFECPRDHFKALDLNTQIPTTLGFKLMKDVHVGDRVFSLTGQPTKVIGESEIFFNRPCYKVIFSTGEEIITDAEHLWITDVRRLRVNKGLRYAPQINTTENIAKTLIYTNKLDVKTGNYYPEYNHRVPVTEAIELDENPTLIIHPYCFGVWLGDGDTNGVGLTSENDEIPNLCRSFGEHVNKHNTYQRYGFVDNFISRLRILGVLGNKYIHLLYMFTSKEQRLLLLQGLMDTDGSVSKEGQCSFTNINKGLVDQVRILAASLGYKPSPIGIYKASLNGVKEYGDFYVFTFYASPENSPFLLPRKFARLRKLKNTNSRQIIAVEPCESVPTKCIMVYDPTGLYLATDSYIPTHNTTIGAVGMPMWWALPFNKRDEHWMRLLGYGDEWIQWMKRAHDQNTRTLVAMEIIKNAWKVGKKINYEYKNNTLFTGLFPEIVPDSSCQWSLDTMTHKRDHTHSNSDANQGEGTYEFTGVDAALQSKHYKRFVLDDLFGKAALSSDLEAESTWEWFKLCAGAFDSDERDPDALPDIIVNGNRWSFKDLNSRIRKELPSFRFHTHSAEGGCCPVHPIGQPIFPEEFSMKKLKRLREWFGDHFYAAQFLNKPTPPGGQIFKREWLRYFVFSVESLPVRVSKATEQELRNQQNLIYRNANSSTTGLATQNPVFNADASTSKRFNIIKHETINGIIAKDIPTAHLYKAVIFDPNHAGEKGRTRNAIISLGIKKEPYSLYLFKTYAEISSKEDAIQEAFKQAEQFRIKELWVEISSGQSWTKKTFELVNETRLKDGKWTFGNINEFPDDRSDNAKNDRINDLEPPFRRGQIYLNKLDPGLPKFIEEFEEFDHGKFKDLLDTLGLAYKNIDADYVTDIDLNSYVQNQRVKLIGNNNFSSSTARSYSGF